MTFVRSQQERAVRTEQSADALWSGPHVRALVGLAVLLITSQVPFLDQPFHMDDVLNLKVARQVLLNPYFPHDFPLLFEGVRSRDSASMEHPPFVPYFLAGIARVTGSFSESTLHSAYLVFPLLTVFSIYWLGKRFTGYPGYAALLLMVCPVFYVVSHTLMSDLPLLALWSLATAMFISGVDSRRVFLLWLSAAAVAGATFTSYAGICLIPLLVLYALLHHQRWAAWLIMLTSLAPLLVWLAVQSTHFGRFTPGYMLHYYFETARVISPALVLQKMTYAVTALGGVTVLPLALSFIHWRRPVVLSTAALVAALAVTQTWILAGYGMIEKTLFCMFFTLGTLLLASASACHASGRCARDQLFLLAWLVGTLAFSVLLYMTGSARYFLPSLPPLIVLLIRAGERKGGLLRRRVGLAAALGALWSLTMASADAELAWIYRRFASDVKPYIGASKLWFTGEWGFRAYLEHLGGEELGRRDARPKQGDFIAVPRLATPYTTLFTELLPIRSLVLVAPCEVSVPLPTLPSGCTLVFNGGMPFPQQSDGIDFTISYERDAHRRALWVGHIAPGDWSRWRQLEIPLRDIDSRQGWLVFSVLAGPTGNATADWLALARGRIRSLHGTSETVHLDLIRAINAAKVHATRGAQYHTPENQPVLIQDVWIKQEPTTAAVRVFRYGPRLPIRVLDSVARAGFWSMGWGQLPAGMNLSKDALEEITLYRVIREADAYGEIEPNWYSQ